MVNNRRGLWLLTGLVLSACAGGLGCNRVESTSDATLAKQANESVPTVSIIPLRVWVAAPTGDSQIWMRQWLAHSEQPLELRSLTIDELLNQPQCDCDVLLYPAQLIGDLVQRDWIVKLPDVLGATGESPDDWGATTTPAVWRQQASYAGRTMGVPLGCPLPVFVVSNSFPLTEAALGWDHVLKSLKIEPSDRPNFDLEASQVDQEALVDRFLAIVATLSDRDPSYGLFFDLQTMQSRLEEDSFVRGAELLAALAGQSGGLDSIIGSHSAAWSWGTTNAQATLAIAAPALLDAHAAEITVGRVVRFQAAESDGARPKVVAWNSGTGLLASLSSQCRQTNQAASLLRWLADPGTRAVLATYARGIESPTPVAGAESLAWKARQSLSEVISGVGVAQEPRLPQATRYRSVLADELIEFLAGRKDARGALQSADRRWWEITQQVGPTQRRSYEVSLGLIL